MNLGSELLSGACERVSTYLGARDAPSSELEAQGNPGRDFQPPFLHLGRILPLLAPLRTVFWGQESPPSDDLSPSAPRPFFTSPMLFDLVSVGMAAGQGDRQHGPASCKDGAEHNLALGDEDFGLAPFFCLRFYSCFISFSPSPPPPPFLFSRWGRGGGGGK